MCTEFELADTHALLDILDRTGVSTINTAWRYTTDLPVHVISGVLKVGQNGHRHMELGELILGDGTEAAIFDSTEIHRETSQLWAFNNLYLECFWHFSSLNF